MKTKGIDNNRRAEYNRSIQRQGWYYAKRALLSQRAVAGWKTAEKLSAVSYRSLVSEKAALLGDGGRARYSAGAYRSSDERPFYGKPGGTVV